MNHSDELIAKVQEALSVNDINVSKVYAKRILTDVVDSIVTLAKDGGVSVVVAQGPQSSVTRALVRFLMVITDILIILL